ncbi:MAG: fibronectin type III domain-containing protein [Thermoplasmatota archaeon]
MKISRRLILTIWLISMMLFSTIPLPVSEAAEKEIVVFRPNGGENITAGSTYRIQWSISTSGGYVTMLLSTDGGRNYDNIKTLPNSPSHGFGWFDWHVPPNINSTSCRVEVVWTDSLTRPYTVHDRDKSDSNFTIRPGVHISFTESPSLISYGRYYLCTLDLYDPHDLVAGLRFTWRTREDAVWSSWKSLPGQYDWYDPDIGWIWWTPDYFESAQGEVRVEAMSRNNISILSTDTTPVFDIISSATTLIQPDGGVTLVAGSTYTIKWRTSSDPEEVIGNIWLRYSTDGGATWTGLAVTTNDYEYDWTVPSISTTQLVIEVNSMYGELLENVYDFDRSSSYNTIIADPNVPSVTLIDPNPPVEGGVVIGSGEPYPIKYSLTGTSNIDSLQISYTTDNGSTYSSITTLTGNFGTSHTWTAPSVDTYEAKVRIIMYSASHTDRTVISNHPFYIFDTIEFNRPPIAMVGPDQSATEGDIIHLDGSGSYDPDGDLLSYDWTKISPGSLDVVLKEKNTPTPHFSVDLTNFPVTFVFELEVSDGYEHELLIYNRDRVTVTVTPRPPEIFTVLPEVAWIGMPIRISGYDLMGAEVLIGDTVVASVPTVPNAANPYPDYGFNFTLYDRIPNGMQDVKVRTMIGEDVLVEAIEIFPQPQWQFDHGLGFQNNHTKTLSYPWNPGGSGRYKDVFGDQVYLSIWVCIGIPYWTPWDGWDCLGYEIKEPIAPDPLASIFYGAVFHYIARYGECFGMSSTALKHYMGDVTTFHFEQEGVTHWTDLEREGEMKRYVQEHQGAQLSSEVLNHYLASLVSGLVPSSENTGMGSWIDMVRSSIDSGDLGIATMICDEGAHAVVPYDYEDTGDKIRFYVYDSNREEFSDPDDAIWMANNAESYNSHPPFIEIERSGVYWDWSFDWTDGTVWSDTVGLAFVPYSVISGGRTLPTSISGITNLLAGSADVSISDEEGNRVGVEEDGSLLWEIEDAAPLPMFGGAGFKPASYYLPKGNYTTNIKGKEEGTYNWSTINNGTSAFSIEDADVTEGSNDTITVIYGEGNPYTGEMAYGTEDQQKVYNGSIFQRYGPRYRTFKVIDAELNDDGEHGDGLHVLSTNGDHSALIFENAGGGATTFDVEFTTNVMSEEAWNGTDRPGQGYLPTARRNDITVGPGETIIVGPSDWLDLNNSMVVIEGETVPGPVQNLEVRGAEGKIEMEWEPPLEDGGWEVLEYEILRGESPDNVSQIASSNTTSFTDDTVERGVNYYYRIRSSNALGPGELSPSVQIMLPLLKEPGSPIDLAGIRESNNALLTWSEPEDDGGSPVLGYVIFRGGSEEEMEMIDEIGNETEYLDTGLEWNTTYHYKVAALNSLGQGPFSETVTVEIPANDTDHPDDDEEQVPEDDEEGSSSWAVYLLIALILLIILVLVLVYARTRTEQFPPEE